MSSDCAALAEEMRADTARSWVYWAVSCSRRDSCWVLTWFSWSRDMVSMFMALPPSVVELMVDVLLFWKMRKRNEVWGETAGRRAGQRANGGRERAFSNKMGLLRRTDGPFQPPARPPCFLLAPLASRPSPINQPSTKQQTASATSSHLHYCTSSP